MTAPQCDTTEAGFLSHSHDGQTMRLYYHPLSSNSQRVLLVRSAKERRGVNRTEAGQSLVGHGPDMPMEVFSGGRTDLDQLVMFLLDASRPASAPAKFE